MKAAPTAPESEPPPKIYSAIAEVRRAVDGYIRKDKQVKTGGEGSYMAVTHDAVTAHCRDALIKAGVLIIPQLEDGQSIEIGQTKNGTPRIRYEATYQITFLCEDDTSSFHIRMGAHAIDTGDKAPGKALSYAVKYAILKLLNIETGENDESRVSEPEDAEPAPPTITEEQAAEPRQLTKRAGRTETAFLSWAKVNSYDEILADNFEAVKKALGKYITKPAGDPTE